MRLPLGTTYAVLAELCPAPTATFGKEKRSSNALALEVIGQETSAEAHAASC
jgi:hypothetical protein